ncbi:2-oxoacid:acceptor oxidoreductase family protein [Desulfopila sp. IMCC35008]|uniref:2-oxoacid:acceptor oxidoreductase family protein n=1 Tax=Desulfopila sp. IMCC35008 TaxID=2653858 RepID=UPI0013D3CA8D|nr:2-oxoacid:acceptor oxidoreductase family protein [Desulfopila sp. IMCC35008]
MLTERVLCAGFGGQGVMSLGQMLAYAGMLEGKNVTWMPSYGPEMRGGTAYCSVVVSDGPVGSPIVTTNATSLIVMNLPSFERFEKSVVPGGQILMNSSLIHKQGHRRDVRVYPIAANELAAACGDPKAANMIMLGAYMALTGSPKLVNVIEAFKKVFGTRSAKMLTLNMKVLEKGMEVVSVDVEPRKAA